MSSQDIHLPSLPPGPPPPSPPAPPPEDASSQALADALRSSFFIVKIIMVGLVLVFLGSGFFTVGPQEKAVILRFGKPVGEGEQSLLASGLHWAFPRPIDEVEHIPFSSIQRAESSVGWFQTAQERAQGAEPGPGTRSLNPSGTVSYALTADTNIVHVKAALTYRITDPIAFHFDFANAPTVITNDLNNALIFVTSQFLVDDLLTGKRAAFQEQVTERVKALIEAQKLGVTIDSIAVADASAPLSLKSQFEAVVGASQKRAKAINDAQTYATVAEAQARADATNRIYVANASSNRLVTMVGAQADAFVKLRGQFEHDPAFFERVSQMKALEQIYTNAANKMVMSPNTHELRLNVSPEVEPPPTNNIISEPY